MLQNRVSSDPVQLSQVLQGLLAEARKRPEIGFVYSGFDPRIPQIEFQVDRDKVKALGIPLNDVFFALQTFLGSYYVNDFNLFGRTYRVQAQAEGAQRSQPDDVNRFYVRSRRRDDGAAVDAGEQPADQRSAVLRALQRLQRRDHQWDATRPATAPARPSRRWRSSHARCLRASPTSGARRRTRRRRPEVRPATSSRCHCCSCSWCWPRSTRAGRCRSRSCW